MLIQGVGQSVGCEKSWYRQLEALEALGRACEGSMVQIPGGGRSVAGDDQSGNVYVQLGLA